MDTGTKNRHLGYKISRIREIKGMKQETLAEELGISQQSVSNLENSEFIEEERLQKVADALSNQGRNRKFFRGGGPEHNWEYLSR